MDPTLPNPYKAFENTVPLKVNICYLFQRLRSIGNLFIANLAAADLCVTAIMNPFTIIGKSVSPIMIWVQHNPYMAMFTSL